jgi:hypothetical protein
LMWGMLLGALLAVTGCERRANLAADAKAHFRAEPPTVASVQSKAERLEKALVEVLESLAAEGEETETPEPETVTETVDLTSRMNVVRVAIGWVQRAVVTPSARPLSAMGPTSRKARRSACTLDSQEVRKLQGELVELRYWGGAMQQLSGGERLSLQQAWGKTEARLRKLAGQIVASNPHSADVFGPVLSDLLRQVHSFAA